MTSLELSEALIIKKSFITQFNTTYEARLRQPTLSLSLFRLPSHLHH